ncbi:MAG: hypothetical protein C4576_04900 [Desulfobacteraceae bacterium]|nr:MAG: hypothetical protein C4576_04900 [Desulfobacteraceae bacterium]
MRQRVAILLVSALLFAVGCAPKLVSYPAGDLPPLGPPQQMQLETPEHTAAAATLWNSTDAILKFYQTDMQPIFNGLHTATQSMDHDAFDQLTPEGIRKNDKWLLLVFDAEHALKAFRNANAKARDPELVKKGELTALKAEQFLKQMRLLVNQSGRMLADGYAYNRSWHEKNLSHLNPENENSFNSTMEKIKKQGGVVRETRDALAASLRELHI